MNRPINYRLALAFTALALTACSSDGLNNVSSAPVAPSNTDIGTFIQSLFNADPVTGLPTEINNTEFSDSKDQNAFNQQLQ
ncbi:hypothetical protein [Litorivivens sp.]|uniref:hypothetical protein n=1 Tax=Litorivivens sp. TaxID=2020868 RepID=UPI003566331C